MVKKIFNYYQSKKNFLVFFFFIFVVQFYDGFLNIYLLLRTNYEERMFKHAGYCEKQAYGFIHFINQKYKNLVDLNIPVRSFLDFPHAGGYFYDTNKKETNKYLIVIHPSEEDLKRTFLTDYQVIEQTQNCYFLEKK